jgi:hypothetical protein
MTEFEKTAEIQQNHDKFENTAGIQQKHDK